MDFDPRLRGLVRRLSPLSVRQYAEARGWRRLQLEGRRFWLLERGAPDLAQLLVPMDADDPGFEDAMMDVAHRLSEVEKRPRESVLEDLRDADSDVVRVRVQTRGSESGSLTLASDVELRDGLRRALLSSACSVISPSTFHPRLSRAEADTLLAACRAGQTEVGSYVVKVACPLHAVEGDGQRTALPFTRLVTSYLMSATAALVASIEGDGIDTYLERHNDGPVVSANLCEALLKMGPSSEEGRVELSTVWAPDPNVAPPTSVDRVSIAASYFPEIERAASKLRPGSPPVTQQTMVGTVETLNGETGPDGRRAGEVVFSLLVGEEQVRARANLGADQYEIAARAHQEGRGYVVLRAILHRGHRIGRLTQLEHLAPLSSLES